VSAEQVRHVGGGIMRTIGCRRVFTCRFHEEECQKLPSRAPSLGESGQLPPPIVPITFSWGSLEHFRSIGEIGCSSHRAPPTKRLSLPTIPIVRISLLMKIGVGTNRRIGSIGDCVLSTFRLAPLLDLSRLPLNITRNTSKVEAPTETNCSSLDTDRRTNIFYL
jgi:hypothetical protein